MQDSLNVIIFLTGVTVIVTGMASLMYLEFNPNVKWTKNLLCKLNFHNFKQKSGYPSYFCQNCKKPKRFPHLKIIKGEKKEEVKNNFKF